MSCLYVLKTTIPLGGQYDRNGGQYHRNIHISRFLKKKTFSSDEYTRNKLIKLQMSLMSQNNLQYFFKPTTASGAKQIMKILSLRKTPDLVIQKTINHLISIKQ